MTDPNDLNRRTLLQLLSIGATGGLAGCSEFDTDDINLSTPTPTFTYGGSPVTTAGPQLEGTPGAEGTPPPTEPSTEDTPPPEPTAGTTAAPAPGDEYGEQAYGQYGYGG